MMHSSKDIYADKIIEELKNGKTLSEISKDILHTSSTAAINRIISRNGIDPSIYNNAYLFMNRGWLSDQIEKLKTPTKIADTFGMPRTSVSRYAARFGLYDPKFTRKAKNEIDETYFKSIDSADKAYWLGFFMADGCVSETAGKKCFEVKIKQSDADLLFSFAKSVGFPENKISLRGSYRRETLCEYASLRTYNKKFVENLESNGVYSHKSGNEIFPNTIPVDLKRDFVRGYCDGDGSISDDRIYICSPSFDMISSLSKWFCFLDIAFTVSVQDRKKEKIGKGVYEIRIAKRSWKKFFDIVYYRSCLGLKRKIDVVEKIRSTNNW